LAAGPASASPEAALIPSVKERSAPICAGRIFTATTRSRTMSPACPPGMPEAP
jgi:hypothetical protein